MLDFFKELFSSVRASAVERVKNPILGALTFSWCAFNWDKILILFFSSSIIEEKIKIIKSTSSIDSAILHPLYSTAAITLLLPFISAITVFFQNKPIMFTVDKQTDRSDHRLSRKIKSEVLRAEGDIAYERVKTGEQLKIQNMLSDIAKSREDASEMQEKIESMYSNLLETQERLSLSEADLEKEKNISTQIRDELERSRFIISTYENDITSNKPASDNFSNAMAEAFRASKG
ncbi:MAG: hypothetical protein ACTINL_06730 [Serratia proteamaculans]